MIGAENGEGVKLGPNLWNKIQLFLKVFIRQAIHVLERERNSGMR